MNKFVSPGSLSPISELLRKRDEQVRSYIYNLKAIDLSDEGFKHVKASIKKSILLEPVVFGTPELVSRSYGQGETLAQQVKGMMRAVFTHRIAFPFTGSRALFDFAPETFGYSKGETSLIRPSNGSVIVEVELSFLHLQKAVLEARKLVSLTMQFIESNNAVAATWSKSTEAWLETELERKRAELTRLYGYAA